MKRLLMSASVAVVLYTCSDGVVTGKDTSFDNSLDKARVLTLPDGRGCTGKIRYAAVHYNFLCNDGRIFFNIENAEVR